MKKWIFISAILTRCLFVTAQIDTAIVKGKVHSGNVTTVKIEWVVDNQITGFQKTYSGEVNNNGEFAIKVPVNKIANGQILVGNFSHDICLLPSDDFFADIDGDTISYKGNGAEKNNFMIILISS